jgi:hypothetical protein
MSNRLLLIIIGLLMANLVVGIVKSPTDTASVTDDGSVGLVRPWFIDEAFASDDRSARAVASIATEAGISAYIKTPTAILLSRAETAFTSVTFKNSNYILGTITPAGYDAYWGAQVMVHKTGWIMAWYHKDWLASTVVHVNDKSFANKTKLSIAIDKVTTALKINAINPTYYHFKYPSANRMLIARKSLVSGYMMRVSYPSSFTYYDTSAYYEYDVTYDNPGNMNYPAGACVAGYWYDTDYKKDYLGLYINDEIIINQITAFPSDNAQYKDLSAKMVKDYMNELEFNTSAGYLTGPSPKRCHTMAIVIVYRG